ncbi:hypothetical protein [Ralstonia pseudosolanacearum]|uniref:hypothetical protein n=1 Tax=Ralstonia pseudosolanacearum TaxID=1310165 RepID=UPI0023DA94CF|nr:hypothetical protein [Ralstonia pseudosolanacearum]
MNPSEFWKNFRLGEEVHIAGTFIYNGLRRFHELRKLDFADELFECLYNLSVGLERLMKIAVVLHEHTEVADQAELEQSLITHSHLDLVARLRPYVDLKLGATHNDLLSLLGIFYKSLRYDRFSLNSVYEGEKEARAVCAFLTKHLQVEFPDADRIFGIDNTEQYRRFIHRTVLKIARNLYEVIQQRARYIGLYTYELRNGSKAESVFLREVKIGDEDVLWKELLIFFMNVEPTTGYLQFLKGTPPLGFDPALVPDYLDCFQSDASKAFVMDELEHHYECMDKEEMKDRLERIGVIGASGVFFDDEIDDDSFEKEEGT